MTRTPRDLRVIIVAEHASASYGGEAILPLHIFRGLRRRGVDARLIIHARVRAELEGLFAGDLDRIHFVEDGFCHRLLFRAGRCLPDRVSYFSTGLLSRLLTQWSARRVARRMVAEGRVDVIHQPTPVSPLEPSLIYGLGVPVVMGPLNGGMSYPEAFRGRQGRLVSHFLRMAGRAASLVHRLIPGKLLADVLLVANDRTRGALPAGARGEVREMIENGVDLSIWRPPAGGRKEGGPLRVVFVGRFIECKAVDLLLEAFRGIVAGTPATLELVGDGPIRRRLEARVAELGLGDSVRFLGWLSQPDCAEVLRQSDVLILPSLHECGGAVVLEALAVGLPVIAANWGGPADYLDPSCGILVDPSSERAFVEGLAGAMSRLAASPGLRREMGRVGREKMVREFDWDRKIEEFLGVYEQTARKPAALPHSRRRTVPFESANY